MVNWTVGENRKAGDRMIRSHMKLALRAFNGECEAALAEVNWNNIVRMQDRIDAARSAINRLGEMLQITITPHYAAAKLEELWLKYEWERKRYIDREGQQRVREQIREEERAKKEIEQAVGEAEMEVERLQKLLRNARSEAEGSAGRKLEEILLKITTFEAKLDEARAKKERATSRAQLTKSGFVYVISNVGSFGDSVFKIGMTRRLEPMDRIYELSGAAVPFPFDLHAMLYSNDAPDLEHGLHQFLNAKRFNLVNGRREFFKMYNYPRSVPLLNREGSALNLSREQKQENTGKAWPNWPRGNP